MSISGYTSDTCACASMPDGAGIYAPDATDGRVHLVDDGLGLDRFGMTTTGTASRVELTVFDDFMISPSGGDTATGVTSPLLEDMLGTFDQLVVQAEVDQVTVGAGPATFSCVLEHSGDGVIWVPKTTAPIIEPFPLTLSPANQVTYIPMGYDAGTKPLLAFVRLTFLVSAATGPVTAHVKVKLTCNDTQEKAFATAAKLEFKAEHAQLPPFYWIPEKKKISKAQKMLANAWTQAYAGAKPVLMTAAEIARESTLRDQQAGAHIIPPQGPQYATNKQGVIELAPISMKPVAGAKAAAAKLGLDKKFIDQLSQAAAEDAAKQRAQKLHVPWEPKQDWSAPSARSCG